MRSVFLSLAAIALYAVGALAQLTINTPPNAVQCEPVMFTWSGGTPPYFLSILPGNQPSAAPLVDLGQQNGTSYTWLVNLPAGTSIGLTLRDSTGAVAQSAPFTILTSTITDCIGRAPSTTSGATSAAGTGATTPAGTTTTKTSAPPATSTSKPSGINTPLPSPTTTGAAPASSTTKSSGASKMTEVGFAGFVGAALLALFA